MEILERRNRLSQLITSLILSFWGPCMLHVYKYVTVVCECV